MKMKGKRTNLLLLLGIFSAIVRNNLALEINIALEGGTCQGLAADLSRARSLSESDQNHILSPSIRSDYTYTAKYEQQDLLEAREDTCGIARQRLERRINDVPIHGDEAVITYTTCDSEETVTWVRGWQFDSVNVAEGYKPTNSIEKVEGAVRDLLGSNARINGRFQVKVFVTEKADYLAYFVKILRNIGNGLEAYDVIIDAHSLSILSICNLVESLEERNARRKNMLRRRLEKQQRNLQVCGTNCNAQTGNPSWTSTGLCPIDTLYLDDTAKTVSCREGTLSGNSVDGPAANPSLFWTGVCECDNEQDDLGNCDCDAPFRNCADAGYDLQFGGEQTMQFLQNHMGLAGGLALSASNAESVGAYAHVGVNYCNAFCCDERDGASYVAVGDCQCPTGPLTSLDVTARLIMSGVTRFTSNLAFSGQSGGLNEAYSDILGTVVEFEVNDPNDTPDFTLGEAFNLILRDMEFPISPSIGDICDYYDGLDVYYSSGVPNRAYVVAVRACESDGCGTLRNCAIDVGRMFLYANIQELTPFSQYTDAASATCALVDEFVSVLSQTITCSASQIRGFVISGWLDVGVELAADTCVATVPGGCIPEPTTAPPTQAPGSDNDLCADAETLFVDQLRPGSTSGATDDNVGTCTVSNTSPGVWYTITGTGNQMIASTCFSANFDTKISVFSGTCASLTCVGGNDDNCSLLRSQVAWQSVSGVEYFILVHGYASTVGDFEIVVEDIDSSTPSNDLCANAIGILLDTPYQGSTTMATYDGFESCAGATAGTAPGLWYGVTGTGSILVATTCNTFTNYDTQLAVYTGNCNSLTCVIGNDDGPCGNRKSQVEWTTQSGSTYYIVVYGYNNAVGNFELLVSVSQTLPPTTAPSDSSDGEETITETITDTWSGSPARFDLGFMGDIS